MDFTLTRNYGDSLSSLNLDPSLFGYTKDISLSKFGIPPTRITYLFDPDKLVMNYQLEVNAKRSPLLYAVLCQFDGAKFGALYTLSAESGVFTLPSLPTEIEYLALLFPMTSRSIEFSFTMSSGITNSGNSSVFEWELQEPTTFFAIPNMVNLDRVNTIFTVNGQIQNDLTDYTYNENGIVWVSTDFDLVAGMEIQIRAVYL